LAQLDSQANYRAEVLRLQFFFELGWRLGRSFAPPLRAHPAGNWPALPVAMTDTIVPDFPLANKSFNLSYAGNDL
ncbi:hypothetical protein, partial [Mycobacterium sp.]|uniref:hypothetical protein n=1 Tax=Mycobacterium sp. TaxID=1785 RepID=UPI003F9C35A6